MSWTTRLAVFVFGLLFWSALFHRSCEAAPPCAVVTSSVAIVDWTPRTPLERTYYATAVCYRKKWQDAESAVKTASVSLAARALPPPPAEHTEPSISPYFVSAIAAVAFLLGAVAERLVLNR